jgi:hypothetical protein
MEALKWYRQLSVHQKINAKEAFELLCGVKFEDLAFLFSLKERIAILHAKLIKEGFRI